MKGDYEIVNPKGEKPFELNEIYLDGKGTGILEGAPGVKRETEKGK